MLSIGFLRIPTCLMEFLIFGAKELLVVCFFLLPSPEFGGVAKGMSIIFAQNVLTMKNQRRMRVDKFLRLGVHWVH
jgi:hypothetical protein